MNDKNKIVIGNLKMYGSRVSNQEHLGLLKKDLNNLKKAHVGLCLPYPYLFQAQSVLEGTQLGWGSQNVAKSDNGPFTGEVSASMLQDFGCKYVIVGHSERSTAYCESNENIATKFKVVVDHGMTPVLCVGETLIEREAGIMERVVSGQLETIINNYGPQLFKNTVIAYEPIWAIGSDLAASTEQANAMCTFIREFIEGANNAKIEGLKIIYGGSVNSENALQLFVLETVDGGLVGRGSLKPEEFIKICKIADQL